MPLFDDTSYKIVDDEISDHLKFNNTLAALKASINQIEAVQLDDMGATTGQALIWNGSSWAPAAAGPGAPATSLPGSPADKQQAILVDSTSSPTYVWLFQWVAAASKWFFLGGCPWAKGADTSGSTTSTSAVTVGTPPSITIPRAGTYVVRFGGRISYSAGVEDAGYTELTKNGTVIGGEWSLYGVGSIRGNAGAVYPTNPVAMHEGQMASLAASDVLSIKNRTSAGNTETFSDRFISVTPVFVT